MNISIGNKIRELRRARNLTQEQLADVMGISFQAVSKWENGIALPDITLVPALASYFEVTIDELFDYRLLELKEKVKAICDEAYKYRESDPPKSRMILEEGLKKFPDNDIILNNILYVMNYSERPDETIALASRLIEKTNDSEVKYDALRFLAYAYDRKGDSASAAAALEQVPELYFSKLSEMAFILSGRAKFEAADKQKWISFEMLIQMMCKNAEYFESDGDCGRALREFECALKLIDVICDDLNIKRYDGYKDYFTKEITRLKG